ncbi:DUF885 domain-containing protein [Oligoflexus tunisiensis]|uniref:DUF885 domain-containing protein n=1 Tax=Oligoflexus tunisiensis TaxID=708132 RepID=UPI000A8D125E|nr:DUF885 domain-containing protein [Oligoflexus tunisiensis]
MHRKLRTGLIALSLIVLAACQTPSQPQTETERLNAFFERAFQENLALSPQRMTALGIKKEYDRFDDISDARNQKRMQLAEKNLAELKTFDFDKLDKEAQLSYQIFERQIADQKAAFPFRFHNFPVNQMFGAQAEVPSFLINMHRIDNEADARAYISRVRDTRRLFGQLRDNISEREKRGIIPPKFVFPKVLSDARNVITGAPFDQGKEPSALLADFTAKIGKVELDTATREALLKDLNQALVGDLQPAYQDLITLIEGLEKKASTRVGAWTLPDGEAFYRNQLRQITTTHLTADEIHQLGLAEVKRIHQDMNAIREKVGYKGNLKQFFAHLLQDDRFYYEQSPAGKEGYLRDTQAMIDRMHGELPELFGLLPKDKLQVKAVEPFREKSAEIGFYNSPAMDGSRPGIFYVNLWDMRQVPKYEMEALAYHEGVPGHHLQLSISQQLKGLPKFRRFGGFTAFIEGWGLYSEYLPKAYGFYKDPYSDFGRLSMELWRACRLVVDTGIHAKRWTREEGIRFLSENTPADEGEIIKAVERYIVMPGQATAYKIGMLKIMELRKTAEEKLGQKFDIRAFHDQILKNGPLPLDLLEKEHLAWLATQTRQG